MIQLWSIMICQNDNVENSSEFIRFSLIKSLDLSHNLLDTINPLFLPKGLEKIKSFS